MSVEVKGEEKVRQILSHIEREMFLAGDDGVLATALEVQREAILSINKQSPGKKGRKVNGTRHVISKEGDAPNTDRGGLVQSIKTSHQKGSQVAYVFSDLDYGAYLEFVLNRPWLGPAFEKKAGNLNENIQSAIRKRLGS